MGRNAHFTSEAMGIWRSGLEEAAIECRGFAQLLRRFGGPGRDRTDDLFHAMEARSQLRHRPTGRTILFSGSGIDSSTNRSARIA